MWRGFRVGGTDEGQTGRRSAEASRVAVAICLGVAWLGACGSGDIESVSSPSARPDGTESAEVDLLYIQDSGGMFGAPQLYAEQAETALGSLVNLHDKTSGGLAALSIRDRMRDESTGWPDLVREAEIIVVWGNPNGSGAREGFEVCIFPSQAEGQMEPFNDADWQPYEEVLKDLFDEIWRIRAGEPVVLRTLGWPTQNISGQREAGIEASCTTSNEAFNDAIRDAAEAGGATFVSMYDVFNGPGHDEDPMEKGWIGPDALHPTKEGSAVIAETLAAVGFEPNLAP